MFSLSEFLDKYGYVAVLIGTFFEGETILVMAGFAAHQGYLGLPGVIGAAFCGSLCGDQFAFFIGRKYGGPVLSRFERLRRGVERARRLLDRYGTPLLLGFRFVYGIRNVTPLAAGASGVSIRRFVVLNVIGAALWAVGVGWAGYLFGRGFALVLEHARRFEAHAFMVMVVLGITAGAVHLWLRFRRKTPRG